jgi:lysophosphatidate acyltransferase
MYQLFNVIPNFTGLAKREIFYFFPFGPASWLMGVLYVNQKNNKSAYDTLAHCKKLMNEKNVKIFIYPEGAHNQSRSFLPFKKGAFNLAIETQSPVIPLVISPYYFIDQKKQAFDKGEITEPFNE